MSGSTLGGANGCDPHPADVLGKSALTFHLSPLGSDVCREVSAAQSP